MEDSPQKLPATGSSSRKAILSDRLDEQQEILIRLSQEMDNYFSHNMLGKKE